MYSRTVQSFQAATLLIQVKNLCDKENSCAAADKACEDMLPSNAFKNDKFDSNELAALDSSCVRIYFQLGSSQAFAVCRPDSDNFQESEQPPESSAGSLQLFGLESRCLCQDSVDLISPVLSNCLDLNHGVCIRTAWT